MRGVKDFTAKGWKIVSRETLMQAEKAKGEKLHPCARRGCAMGATMAFAPWWEIVDRVAGVIFPKGPTRPTLAVGEFP
jgi:hypothetical protein